MCVTDPVGEQLAELQLMLGEGPCHDVLASAAPVLAADLGDEASGRRWPGFAPEARRAGAAAVFAFPLMIGVIRAGAMGMYPSRRLAWVPSACGNERHPGAADRQHSNPAHCPCLSRMP
jgi:hypothetical protein